MYKLLIFKAVIVLYNLIFNFDPNVTKLCKYIKCLNVKLKVSLRKNKFNLNLNDGRYVCILNKLKKKLKYFS